MYLGIEIGGTKLQLGIGPADGTLRALWRDKVDPAQGAEGIRSRIERGLPEVLAQAGLERSGLKGVGIGFGGPVDTSSGTVTTSHQVEGWDRFPLVKWFDVNFGWPAVLHNDADTAAFAEATFGAGRGFDPVMYVTVGSGIGGGLVCGGKVYRGCGQGALEIGHLRPGNLPLHIPAPGATIEGVASGFGIEQRATQAIADWEAATVYVESRFASSAKPTDVAEPAARGPLTHPHERFSALMKLVDHDRSKITTRILADAARQGDRFARELFSDATDTLGWALAQAVTLLNPGRIVIGGGVSLIGQELFFDPLRKVCRNETFKPFAGVAEIVPASLGEEVVLYGAVALARAAFDDETLLRPFIATPE